MFYSIISNVKTKMLIIKSTIYHDKKEKKISQNQGEKEQDGKRNHVPNN